MTGQQLSLFDAQTLDPAPPVLLADTGLLSPTGEFFPCDWGRHSDTYQKLRTERNLPHKYYDQAGFIHLSDGCWDDPGSSAEVTQSQIDAIFDWVQLNPADRNLPRWLMKRMEAGK